MLGLLTIAALLLSLSALYLTPMESDLGAGIALTEGFLRQTRATAMATTSAYRVRPTSNTRLVAETGSSCLGDTWIADADLSLELPGDVALADTAWSVCFGSRGLASGAVTIGLAQPGAGSRRIAVLRGGTTRVVQ